MLNGDAHLSEVVEGELRIRPVALFSKTGTKARIAHGRFDFCLSVGTPRKGDLCRGPRDPRGGEGPCAAGGLRTAPPIFAPSRRARRAGRRTCYGRRGRSGGLSMAK